ncbi:FMN-dependent NADH-azoreductase [Thalassolituus sp. UBA2590]|uniref:FMN-dependent NADH-azoreductase n=1 Tax=Thalassolituus sp. UBA2590 TaxID=1947663 RepID=UPI000C0CB0B3|nr:NAD(P)H-dependent oxidoreductase [Thalassolituus sp. UBA2590]MBN56659.1 FMN-dependent NADH-azoreductase [Oceanospirillaceae bacterium]MDQ4422287.1 NAD(P)H-dependent oxidoreductase [Thalassolituus sp.]
MTHILRVDSSMRTEGSVSRNLADKLVERLSDGSTQVTERDLANGIELINENWIGSNFTDPADRSDEQKTSLATSDELVNELRAADTVVITAPVYNFHVPAALKAWIDMVARARETFRYTEEGPVGLLTGKKVYVVMTSGGTVLGAENDFVSGWLKYILAFMGMTDVTFIDSSGLMLDETKAEKAEAEIADVA